MPRPSILLDRDGTIIVERGYLSDPDEVVLERNAAAGLRAMSQAGWPLVVLTNQSGVARGYFDRAAVNRVNHRVADLLALAGIEIAGWYVCPHGPDEGCACRKPRPGMALAAAHDLNLDLSQSWMIGDKRADIGLGEAIGASTILVATGHGAAVQPPAGVRMAADLLAASQLIAANQSAFRDS